MIDLWNPDTFTDVLLNAITKNNQLIIDYYHIEQQNMNEYLHERNVAPLKDNSLHYNFRDLHENIITPILFSSRIRMWHYTRLFDHEVDWMKNKITPSSLPFLKMRLEAIVKMGHLSQSESESIYEKSPLQKEGTYREGRLWGVTVPFPTNHPAVLPLLSRWGGESVYCRLSDSPLKEKLRTFGKPRIIEIETSVTDKFNAFSAATTTLEAWAKKSGIAIKPEGSDIAITNCIDTIKTINVNTENENKFHELGICYPENINKLIK